MHKFPSPLSDCVRRLRSLAAIAPLALSAAVLPGGAAAAQDAAAPAVARLALRPASKPASVTLEGASQPITLSLFEWAPASPSPGFSTYVPQDMRAPGGAGGQGGQGAQALRFVADFGGVLQERAYLEFSLLPAGTTPAQALASLRRSVPGGALPTCRASAGHQFGWSLGECDIAYRSNTGSRVGGVAALGRHGDRYFRLTLHYPLEYGGGLVPRADLILQEWRWRDTGTGL